MNENTRIQDALDIALTRARGLGSDSRIVGYGVAVVRGADGAVKQIEPFANLVTDKGDEYYAKKAIVGISPANATAPTAVNGMKLGTGTTAAAKSGAGAAIVTYLSGSNVAFDSTYPQAAAVGTDAGWNVTYQTTWAAGVATNSAITEVAIVNDQATNATTTAANSIARAVLTAINKAAGDSLTITWSHKFLGA